MPGSFCQVRDNRLVRPVKGFFSKNSGERPATRPDPGWTALHGGPICYHAAMSKLLRDAIKQVEQSPEGASMGGGVLLGSHRQ